MRYCIEEPKDKTAVVSLVQDHNGVIINVGDWFVAKLHNSGQLMLASGIPEDNEEGMRVAGDDSVISIARERF